MTLITIVCLTVFFTSLFIYAKLQCMIFSNPQVSQTNGNWPDTSGVYFLPGSTVVQLSFYLSTLLSPNELCRGRFSVYHCIYCEIIQLKCHSNHFLLLKIMVIFTCSIFYEMLSNIKMTFFLQQ